MGLRALNTTQVAFLIRRGLGLPEAATFMNPGSDKQLQNKDDEDNKSQIPPQLSSA